MEYGLEKNQIEDPIKNITVFIMIQRQENWFVNDSQGKLNYLIIHLKINYNMNLNLEFFIIPCLFSIFIIKNN